MQTLQVYEFKENKVRVQLDDKGEPWWVAKDVCDILQIQNITTAMERIPPSHLGKTYVAKNGTHSKAKGWNMVIVDEAGLNYLISRSNSPLAKPYQEWVNAVVLPSIRKTGSYSVEPAKNLSQLDIMQQAIDILRNHDREITTIKQEITTLTTEFKTIKETHHDVALLAPVKSMDKRHLINALIRQYASAHGNKPQNYQRYWNTLYYEFKYRYGIDLHRRKENAHFGRIIDVAEKLGCTDHLYILATNLFKVESKTLF